MVRIPCHRVPPRLAETVRNSWGTARSASSAVLMITGRVMMARVREPARMDVPNRRNSTNIPRPNRPYTMEGMPARFTMARRMARVSRVSRAYSERYTAPPTPMGTATSAVPRVRRSVPTMAGQDSALLHAAVGHGAEELPADRR